MSNELTAQLEAARQALEPQFKELRQATAALKQALRLSADDKPDAIPMHKASLKLEQAAEAVPDEALQAATRAFRSETEQALGALAFDFARDLRQIFAERGIDIGGRPPVLSVGELTLQIDIAARTAQWYYGREQLTRKLPLSSGAIMKAYEQQRKEIVQRDTDPAQFLQELYSAWQTELSSRARAPRENRLNLVETFSKMTMARQTARFWNAPSRGTFKDYPRPLFVRDLVIAQAAPTVTIDGQLFRLRLGVATKSQADSAARSVWLPDGALDGQYFSDITFEEAGT